MTDVITSSSYVLQAEALFEEEKNLQEMFQNELFNRFAIGKKLYNIREKKSYRFKDTEGTYTWVRWANEFMGSHQTADRFIKLWFIFEKNYNYTAEALKNISPTYLYEIVPLLTTKGELKPKEYVDELLNQARISPSLKEFKKALIQSKYSLEELHVEGGHDHQWKKYHYQKCNICEKTETIL